jgi:hypothetical protein
VRYVHPPGAKPERELAWREMAVSRTWRLPGSRERLSPTRRNWRAGPARLRVRDSGRPRRRPGGGRQEIAFIVVASAIGKDEVFDSINTAANTRYGSNLLRCSTDGRKVA